MKYRSTALGEVVEGDDPAHPDVDKREEILKRALTAWGWEADIERHEPLGRFVKFTAESQTPGTAYTLEVYIFANLADSARNRPHEKRIQITRDYEEHQADFQLDKVGSRRCLLLGFYCLEDDEVIICAWDAAAYQGHAKPTSAYVHIEAIAGAFRFGFARSQDAKGRYVCCFRPEFLHYYVENMAQLHVVEASGAGVPPEEEMLVEVTSTALSGGENIIFYGAPGTGKTHTVDAMVDGKLCVRTVFHPDMQNTDFVGALKPVMQEDRVTYSFSPGPFALALRNALAHPDRENYLVIEELNRAPAAAVFGDLFLLLDRDGNGAGTYDVDFPTPEFKAWLSTSLGREVNRASLPSNLWLLATMNSADQGVYPIDTAFRRRWRQEYVPIDYSTAPSGALDIVLTDGSVQSVPWHVFAQTVNEHLTQELDIAEDRLLGPWFATAEDISRSSLIPGKVLIYLWDDLLRHHGREKIFDVSAVKTFGEVSARIAASQRIFSDTLLSKLSGGEAASEA
jgi:hypothetical protein